MNRHSVFVALALLALPAAARAQRDPSPAAESDALAAPALPATPPQLRAAVDALRSTVANTEECYTAGGRMEHEADARCPQWYARIARSGPAAVFAIGALFTPATNGDGLAMEPVREMGADNERGPRLVQLLASAGRPEAAPFLVSYLVRTATLENAYASETDAAALAALRALSGDDPAPTAPWEGDGEHLASPLARRELAGRWLAWLRESEGRTVAQWRAAGLARAQQRLASDDIVERYSAIRRLAAVPAQRAVVTASLHALLAREDLPAAARVHLQRLARLRRIPLPAQSLVAAR
jgi:hypothetical protein